MPNLLSLSVSSWTPQESPLPVNLFEVKCTMTPTTNTKTNGQGFNWPYGGNNPYTEGKSCYLGPLSYFPGTTPSANLQYPVYYYYPIQGSYTKTIKVQVAISVSSGTYTGQLTKLPIPSTGEYGQFIATAVGKGLPVIEALQAR